MQGPEPLRGLSSDEAAIRLQRFGHNVVREPKSRSVREIALGTLREPMFLLLLAAATLYLVIGDLAEGIFLSAGAMLSFSLVVVQEARSERALRALNALSNPVARVVRDGSVQPLPSSELVPGDIVILGEGGRVPADSMLIQGDALEVDESTLSGESAPCTKTPVSDEGLGQLSPPGEVRSSSLFASTLIVRGQGVARVVQTGASTVIGRIGAELADAREPPTLVQRDVRRLVGIVGGLAILFCILVALFYGLFRNDWLAGALSGLTLAISLVPEEFPMVLAIFMALGALRLAKHNVLIRRSAVIETLGATTLLCVDKTGTLTENRMALRRVWREGLSYDLARDDQAPARLVVEAARLASAVQPHDAMDLAIQKISSSRPAQSPLRSYPLSASFLAFVQVWPAPEGGVVYAAKGAHEAIFPLVEQEDVTRAQAAAHSLGQAGMRVLAVATARFDHDPCLPPQKVSYQFQGLLGFEDPVREDVPAAISEARLAGVEIAMITGDFPTTALVAAETAGILTSTGVITGADLTAGKEIPIGARIFARIMPEQKLELIRAFQQAGHVTAMTGDGINDAPALAAADVGIAMGQRGTDVAREAADLILLDDRFASIVRGIALGRRIFTNLRRAMTYITAVHIPVAGLALVPIVIGLPPMLYPMHLVLLELVIDPICSIVFESEPSEADAMRKPPRAVGERLFGKGELGLAILQGTILLAAVLALYAWLNVADMGEGVARPAAFTALVAGQLSLAFSPSRAVFWWIAGGAAVVLGLAMYLPVIQEILRFTQPPAWLLLLSLGIGLLAGGWSTLFRPTLGRKGCMQPLNSVAG